MKVKLITLALGLAASTAVFAASSDNAQLIHLQQQLQRLQSQVSALQAGKGGKDATSSVAGLGAYIGTDSNLTWSMMSNYSGQGREMNILNARKAGQLGNHAVYFGGYAKVDALWQISSKKMTAGGQFRNQYFQNSIATGSNGTAIQLTGLNLLTTADLNNWTTLYLQLGGQGVGASGSSNDVNFQQAYLLFGDLNKAPAYAFIGKKDVDFGNFASVNLYSQPLNRELFAAYGDQAGVGYSAYGANVTATIINGGQNGNNLYTSNNSSLNNFAVNASYGNTYKNADWKVGAGYLNGVSSQFVRNGGKTNGAWDLNGQLSLMNFDVLAEYTQTTGNTFATNSFILNSDPSASTVQAWNIGLAYNFMFMGRHSKVSASYSSARMLSESDMKKHTFAQYVVGVRNEFLPNVWGGFEYSYDNGVITAAGTSHYDQMTYVAKSNVNNNTLLLDLTAAF